jgi:hypothetical protein
MDVHRFQRRAAIASVCADFRRAAARLDIRLAWLGLALVGEGCISFGYFSLQPSKEN